MKDVKIKVMNEFDGIGVKIGQLSCTFNEEGDIHLCGTVKSEQCLDDYLLQIKANICNEENNVLYVLSTFEGISFEYTKFDGFTIFCTQLNRFMDVSRMSYVEIYPKLKKKND